MDDPIHYYHRQQARKAEGNSGSCVNSTEGTRIDCGPQRHKIVVLSPNLCQEALHLRLTSSSTSAGHSTEGTRIDCGPQRHKIVVLSPNLCPEALHLRLTSSSTSAGDSQKYRPVL